LKNIKLIVGLCNPSFKYAQTRHNIGSWFVKKLAKKYNITFKKKFLGDVGNLLVNNNKIRLFIPNTFMNLSGEAVYWISNFYNFNLSNILIVHDELELIPGQIKFKISTGHGGHNGIRSILKKFNLNCKFYKISIGIGRPKCKKDVSYFVLSKPDKLDKLLIVNSIDNTIRNILKLIVY